jgi:hypothetical protein
MNESEATAMVEAASLELYPSVTETLRRTADSGLDLDRVSDAARQAVIAWLMAINGDDTTLAAHGEPDAVSFFLREPWKRWHVAPGPRVTGLEIWRVAADQDPPLVSLKFAFSGRRHFPDPSRAMTSELAEGETQFVGTLELALPDAAGQRWNLRLGAVDTLDGYLGYVFTSRPETFDEYRQRTGLSVPPAADRAERMFKLVAGFADHDVKFGAEATANVRLPAPPTRYEAVDLIWPAVEAETTRALGEGDWRPSLSWLEVIELLGD